MKQIRPAHPDDPFDVESHVLMLRSLVAPTSLPGPDETVLRRNLSPVALSEALAGGETVWIDLVDPGPDEIEWLEENFKLHPAIISDLKREDRRPAVLLYPAFLFLSLVQAQ